MATRAKRSDRRDDALSRETIVSAAIAILDAEGEGGLTFRALAERLSTGAGAMYWHVANKEELLVAATEVVISGAVADQASGVKPEKAIRALAIGVFDAIDAHPWVGTQLARAPAQSAMLTVFERIGRSIQALGVPHARQFTAASALVNYILGVGSQNAANARMLEPSVDRQVFLNEAAAGWQKLDLEAYAFTRSMAGFLSDHDDRAEFLAGIDLIVAGLVLGGVKKRSIRKTVAHRSRPRSR